MGSITFVPKPIVSFYFHPSRTLYREVLEGRVNIIDLEIKKCIPRIPNAYDYLSPILRQKNISVINLKFHTIGPMPAREAEIREAVSSLFLRTFKGTGIKLLGINNISFDSRIWDNAEIIGRSTICDSLIGKKVKIEDSQIFDSLIYGPNSIFKNCEIASSSFFGRINGDNLVSYSATVERRYDKLERLSSMYFERVFMPKELRLKRGVWRDRALLEDPRLSKDFKKIGKTPNEVQKLFEKYPAFEITGTIAGSYELNKLNKEEIKLLIPLILDSIKKIKFILCDVYPKFKELIEELGIRSYEEELKG